MTDWLVGDQITLTIVDALGITHTDGFFHGATFTSGVFGTLDQVTVPANGTVTVTHTVIASDLTNGIAIDPENNDSITATAICTKAATATALTAVPNPSTFGQSVTLTATVTSGNGTPDGFVAFKEGLTSLGNGTLAGGVATLNIATLDVGSHTLTAVYHGNFNFSTSASSPVTQVVNKGTTSTALAGVPNPSTFGQTVTLTATVTSAGGTPAGPVVFKEGLTNLGSASLVGNKASITVSTLDVGNHSLTAVYHGNFQFLTSTSPVMTQVVDKAPTSTAVASGPNPSKSGQTVTLTATVSSSGGTPAGFVAFKNGAVTLGTSTLAGNTATFTTSALTVGSHLMRAVYHGNFQFATSTSPAVTQVVNSAGPTCSLSTSPSTINSGQSSVLSWESKNATRGRIESGIGAVGRSGSIVVSPSQSTTYHGTFTGPQGTANCDVTISQRPHLAILHSFQGGGDDGAQPVAGLIADRNGALYGTTSEGGPANRGTVFRLTPPAAKGAGWTYTVLHKFGGSDDGSQPVAGLILDRRGALFGTTSKGGAANLGTVFKLTPPVSGASQWTPTILHSFIGGNDDGSRPVAGLIAGPDGALYGTTLYGGGSGCDAACGTVFKLAQVPGKNRWKQTILHRFAPDSSDGSEPNAELIADQDGTLYGTTSKGGNGNAGTVFQLLPPAPGQQRWAETVLYSFRASGGDGTLPRTGLIADQDGSLYGTTRSGGASNSGAVFKLAPPSQRTARWTETLLYSFVGGDGASPHAGVVLGADGALYATARWGGASNNGTVVKLTPRAAGRGKWNATLLHDFQGDVAGGAEPFAELTTGQRSVLYGTTKMGGAANLGTVFKLTH